MNAGRRRRACSPAAMMRDGPFPVHYEPFESPGRQLRCPEGARQPGGARVRRRLGAVRRRAQEFPYVATTYRLTEHFHFWTKHVHVNAVLQPEFFVEISRGAGRGEGHRQGRLGAGVVEARRGHGQGGGHQAHQAADVRRQDRPYRRHPASTGASSARRKKGFGANTLTPFVGDANIETPEFKAFLVNIEPIDRAGGIGRGRPWFPDPNPSVDSIPPIRRAGPDPPLGLHDHAAGRARRPRSPS